MYSGDEFYGDEITSPVSGDRRPVVAKAKPVTPHGEALAWVNGTTKRAIPNPKCGGSDVDVSGAAV